MLKRPVTFLLAHENNFTEGCSSGKRLITNSTEELLVGNKSLFEKFGGLVAALSVCLHVALLRGRGSAPLQLIVEKDLAGNVFHHF
jgi:hypothetical protein